MLSLPPRYTLFPYTTLFRSGGRARTRGGGPCVRSGSEASSEGPGSGRGPQAPRGPSLERSEEHTSELQSRGHLVCRLLLEKKKQKYELDDGLHTCKQLDIAP